MMNYKLVQIQRRETGCLRWAERREFSGVAMAWGWDYHWSSKLGDDKRIFSEL